MLRRGVRVAALPLSGCVRFATTAIPQDVREKLSKSFMSVKEEAKGQALDLGDMAEAARNAAKAVATATKSHPVEDAKFKGKLVTLNASMKAYNSRLMNLQSEARALQNDVDAIMKLLWSNQAGEAGSTSEAEPAAAPEVVEGERISQPDDFGFEPPKAKPATEGSAASAKVETVEGEVVSEDSSSGAKTASSGTTSSGDSEIEIESIEIEETAESKSITDITKELHEKNIDFSDCLDSKSLRQRYQEFLDGKVKPPKFEPPKPAAAAPQSSKLGFNKSSYSSSSSSQQQSTASNTTETGLTPDPHPGAERRQVDSSKFVWELKAEMAREKGIDPSSLDMWCGMTLMEDHKRVYEIPGVQSYPIQVRQKGDRPTSPYGR